jgi:sRNA-binding protein
MTEEELRAKYPWAFDDLRLPLKVGIHLDLDLPPNSEVLGQWVRHPRYLKNVKRKNAVRINLQGEVTGKVTKEEQEYADDLLHSRMWSDGWGRR